MANEMTVGCGEFCVRISEETERLLREISSRTACTLPIRGDRVHMFVDDGKWSIGIGPARYSISTATAMSAIADIDRKIPVPPWGGDWWERNSADIPDKTYFDGNVGGKVELPDPPPIDQAD